MPDITIPNVDINKAATDLNNAVKEGAYVAVGLGVLGFQRAQVQRVELTKQLESQRAQLSNLSSSLNSQAETYITQGREQAEAARIRIAAQLSELSKALEGALAPAREQLSKAIPTELPNFPDLGQQLSSTTELIEGQIESLRTQLVELAKAVDARVAPARQQLDEQLDRVEAALPAGARSVVQSVRSAASSQEQALRTAVGLS